MACPARPVAPASAAAFLNGHLETEARPCPPPCPPCRPVPRSRLFPTLPLHCSPGCQATRHSLSSFFESLRDSSTFSLSSFSKQVPSRPRPRGGSDGRCAEKAEDAFGGHGPHRGGAAPQPGAGPALSGPRPRGPSWPPGGWRGCEDGGRRPQGALPESREPRGPRHTCRVLRLRHRLRRDFLSSDFLRRPPALLRPEGPGGGRGRGPCWAPAYAGRLAQSLPTRRRVDTGATSQMAN